MTASGPYESVKKLKHKRQLSQSDGQDSRATLDDMVKYDNLSQFAHRKNKSNIAIKPSDHGVFSHYKLVQNKSINMNRH